MRSLEEYPAEIPVKEVVKMVNAHFRPKDRPVTRQHINRLCRQRRLVCRNDYGRHKIATQSVIDYFSVERTPGRPRANPNQKDD